MAGNLNVNKVFVQGGKLDSIDGGKIDVCLRGTPGPTRLRMLRTEDDELPNGNPVGPLNEFVFTGPIFDLDSDDPFRTGLNPVIDIEVAELQAAFISAQISKVGGTNHDTTVILALGGSGAGNIVAQMSYRKARILGLKRDNPFGIVYKRGRRRVRTLTIGFGVPLIFDSDLKLYMRVAEPGVTKVEATIMFTAVGGGGGDVPGTGGGGGETPFP